MDSLIERNGVRHMFSSKLALATRRRGRSYPFSFRMGPISLCIMSVVLLALMSVLYLSHLGYAVAANQQLQTAHFAQATLLRQNLDLVNIIAQEQSPAYIAAHAQHQGLFAADPQFVHVLSLHHLLPVAQSELNLLP